MEMNGQLHNIKGILPDVDHYHISNFEQLSGLGKTVGARKNLKGPFISH
jgi:hypothetical protein